jgi:SAM-dependent methyltransferase
MTGPDRKNHEAVYRHEIEFFAGFYKGHHYHPVGWKLRLERELHSLLHQAGTDRLGRVLSLGCGDGQFELLLAAHADQVIGLDISPEAVAEATRAAQAADINNVEFRCLPVEELDWGGPYDTIICLATLHHVPPEDVRALLHHIFDHLTPGGLFYSQDPNRNGWLRWLWRVLSGNKRSRFHSPDERELDPVELAWQFHRAGFEDVVIGYIDLTLIPGLFLFSRGPAWPMKLLLWVDWLWCHSPLAPWASGLYASARRAKGGQ